MDLLIFYLNLRIKNITKQSIGIYKKPVLKTQQLRILLWDYKLQMALVFWLLRDIVTT